HKRAAAEITAAAAKNRLKFCKVIVGNPIIKYNVRFMLVTICSENTVYFVVI
ncbi:unnamed protein product, partial [marine sediment metagenome]